MIKKKRLNKITFDDLNRILEKVINALTIVWFVFCVSVLIWIVIRVVGG